MSADVKEIREQLELPAPWRLVQGSLEELALENSQEIVVFEKQFPESILQSKSSEPGTQKTSPTAAENPKNAADSKEKKEASEHPIELIRVVLCRAVKGWHGYDIARIPKLAIFLLFGNPLQRAPENLYIDRTAPLHKRLEDFQMNIRYPFGSVSVEGEQSRLSSEILKNINPEGSILTIQNMGWLTETRRDYKMKGLFQIFQENGFFTQKEALYFQSICGHKKPSLEETRLKNKITELLAKPKLTEEDLDAVVNFTKEAHQCEIEAYLDNHKQTESCPIKLKPYVDDESDLAYNVAMRLEPISPRHAIRLLQIVANYHLNPSTEYSINSPFEAAAIEKMADIQMNLCGDNSILEVDKKKLRKEALQTLIAMLDPKLRDGDTGWMWTSISKDSAKKASQLILNLLERHSGFDWSTGPFGKITMGSEDQDVFKFFSQVMVTMASELFKRQDSKEAKEVAERNLSQEAAASGLGKTLTFSSPSMSLVSSSSSASTAIQARSTVVVTSLDSDDEEEASNSAADKKASDLKPSGAA